MQRVQPEVLIDGINATRVELRHRRRSVLVVEAVVRRVHVACRRLKHLRIIQDFVEEGIGIEQECCDIAVHSRQVRDEGLDLGVEGCDGSFL